jgi:hypothetical protein
MAYLIMGHGASGCFGTRLAPRWSVLVTAWQSYAEKEKQRMMAPYLLGRWIIVP